VKKLAIVAVIIVAIVFLASRDACGRGNAVACPAPELEEGWGTTIGAAEICPSSGYLCGGRRQFQIVRWPLTHGTLRVRVGLPRFEDDDTGESLRAAVVEGIRAWDGHPFPLIVDDAAFSMRIADIDVVWTQGLYNAALGVSNISWSKAGKRLKFKSDGLGVVVPPIPAPERGGKLAATTRAYIVQAAMHEMGHALGLGHSDSPLDIMFPRLRPEMLQPRLSQRDLRTVDALYLLPNGASVR
jgi:hypothetical protein